LYLVVIDVESGIVTVVLVRLEMDPIAESIGATEPRAEVLLAQLLPNEEPSALVAEDGTAPENEEVRLGKMLPSEDPVRPLMKVDDPSIELKYWLAF